MLHEYFGELDVRIGKNYFCKLKIKNIYIKFVV